MLTIQEIAQIIFKKIETISNVRITANKILVFNVWMWDRKEIIDLLINYVPLMSSENDHEEVVNKVVSQIIQVRDNFQKIIVGTGYYYDRLNSFNEQITTDTEKNGIYYLRPSGTHKNRMALCYKLEEKISSMHIYLNFTNPAASSIYMLDKNNSREEYKLNQSIDMRQSIEWLHSRFMQAHQLLPQPLKLYNGMVSEFAFKQKLQEVSKVGLETDQTIQILGELFNEKKTVSIIPLHGYKTDELEKDLIQQFNQHKALFNEKEWIVFGLPVAISSNIVNHMVGVAINCVEKTIHYQDDYNNQTIVSRNLSFFKEKLLPIINSMIGVFNLKPRLNNSQSSEKDCSVRTISFLDSLVNHNISDKLSSPTSLYGALETYYRLWLKTNLEEQAALLNMSGSLESIVSYLNQYLAPSNLNKVQQGSAYGWKIGRGIVTCSGHHSIILG